MRENRVIIGHILSADGDAPAALNNLRSTSARVKTCFDILDEHGVEYHVEAEEVGEGGLMRFSIVLGDAGAMLLKLAI